MIVRFCSSLMLTSFLLVGDSFAMRGRDGNEPKHPLMKKSGQSAKFRDTVQTLRNRREVHVLCEELDENDGPVFLQQLLVMAIQNPGVPLTCWAVGATKAEVNLVNQEIQKGLKKQGIQCTPPKFRAISELPISGKNQLMPYLRSAGGSTLFRHYYDAHTQSETSWGPRSGEFQGGLVPFNFFKF